ncbi:MerR family DNA-binding protein [Actinomadura citrea]|uniref:MerR family DNA-binding protein n=1 Tax=Actinomadura citrea TaxID=46158 RepID=UPI001C54E719
MPADVARINRVLIYRELGLPLDDIGELLDAPTVDMTVPPRRQRAQLLDRISRLRAMVDAVDRMIEAASAGILLSGGTSRDLRAGLESSWLAGAHCAPAPGERWWPASGCVTRPVIGSEYGAASPVQHRDLCQPGICRPGNHTAGSSPA